MKSVIVLAGLVAAEHPIANVIQMMVDLRVKAKEEGENEALVFQKYSHWCGNEQKSYSSKIAKNKQTIQELSDKIAGLEASNASLTTQIAKLEAELNKRKADAQKADEIRGNENEVFVQSEQDFKDTIQAISDAVAGLKGSKKPGLAAVKRVVKKAAIAASSIMSHSEHKVLHAFLQEEPVSGTGRVREYDFHSGGVIELLEKLQHDFESQLLDAQKGETNAVNAHELTAQAQDAAIEAAQASHDTKTSVLAGQESDLATLQQDNNEEKETLKENEKTLKDTVAECQTKSNEFEERAKTRAGEQNAITKAIEILAKVGGVRNPDTHEIAKRENTSFLQLNDPRDQAVKLIAASARLHKNSAMQRLAQQIRMTKGPFTQIKNQIQKMIFRLNKEQTDEDNHKHWCDTEIETTQQQLEDKKEKLDSLQAKIDKLRANIQALTEKINEDEESVADTNEYMKDETELRNANHKQNLITIDDSQKAQKAVSAAIAVLTQFYKESGGVAKEAWEFVQVSKQDPGFEGAFNATDGHTAVLELLEDCLQKFSSMEAEASAADEGDAQAHAEDMSQNKIKLAELRNNIKMKSARKNTAEQNLQNTENQHKKVSNQKYALDVYMKDLEPACIKGDSTYEERKASRVSEIEALKDALGVLKKAFDAPPSFLARNM